MDKMKEVVKEIKKTLLGKRIKVVGESTTIFKRVTDVIEASEALKDPEIRSGTKNPEFLLYIIKGILDFTDNKYVSEVTKNLEVNEIMVYVYTNTIISLEEEPIAVV